MQYSGRARLQYAAKHRIIGSGHAELVEVNDEVNIAWKGRLVLDDVVDATFLAGKTGDHFELRLLECEDEPVIPAVVRHIDRMVVSLVGREPLPDCG